jgi:hypothetical protein
MHLKRTSRLAGALAVGIAMTCSSMSEAQAAPGATNGVDHFMTCLGLIFSNGAQHAQECGPNPYVPSGQLAPTTGGGPSGGGTSCAPPPVGSIRPLFPAIEIASLDGGNSYVPAPSAGLPAPGPSMLLAIPDPCHHHCAMLADPLGAGVGSRLADEYAWPERRIDRVAVC